MEKSLAEQIGDVIESLLLAEFHAKRMLKTAKEKRISFGLTYNYVDEDINQIIGRLRHMKLMADRRESPT
jgi:signal recognition particle GTPase